MTHVTEEQLQQRLKDAKELVEVGGIYYHYKNAEHFYVVESVGFIEATEEVCVVYRALYDKGLVWVRTLENFTEVTEKGARFIKAK